MLEPLEVEAPGTEPMVAVASRPALVPPDPEAFRRESVAPAKTKAAPADSTRWLVRIALVLVLLAEELLLAAPAGALHPPRDVSEAGSMVVDAMRGSATAALDR